MVASTNNTNNIIYNHQKHGSSLAGAIACQLYKLPHIPQIAIKRIGGLGHKVDNNPDLQIDLSGRVKYAAKSSNIEKAGELLKLMDKTPIPLHEVLLCIRDGASIVEYATALTLFQAAVDKKDSELIGILVNHGANTEAATRACNLLAHKPDKAPQLQTFLNGTHSPIIINGRDNWQVTPLSAAIDGKSLEAVRLLIGAGVYIDSTTPCEPRFAGRRQSRSALWQAFPKEVSKTDSWGKTTYHTQGDMRIVDLLAKAKACLTTDLWMIPDFPKHSERLIDLGARWSDLNRNFGLPEELAVDYRDPKFLDAVLKRRTFRNPSAKQRYLHGLMKRVCTSGSLREAQVLLSHGLKLNKAECYLPLICERGDIEILKLLGRKGVKINTSSKLLEIACERRRGEIAHFLLAEGTPVSKKALRFSRRLHDQKVKDAIKKSYDEASSSSSKN